MIHDEEESFLRTLDRGIALFEDAAERAASAKQESIAAADAFKLHDTYGFPIDLTRVMAEERGMTVDEAGYEALMAEAREVSRRGGGEEEGVALPPDAIAKLEHMNVKPTEDRYKYDPKPLTAHVRAIWDGGGFDERAHAGATVALILDRTNHYAEAGGQVGDTGDIYAEMLEGSSAPARGYRGREGSNGFRFEVKDTQECGGYVLHVGRVMEGKISVGAKVNVAVDLDRRRPTLANHTGTHLLNHALRETLGEEVNQRGSLVAPDRLRFDFSCSHAMTAEEVEQAEALVNSAIEDGLAVYEAMVPLEEAMSIHGLRAVFGERYPDPVRVVSIGKPVEELVAQPGNEAWYGYSVELCGGTHLKSSDEAGALVIVQEQALAAGVRRVTALTGAAARAAVIAGRELEARVREAGKLSDAKLVEKFDDLVEEYEHLTMSSAAKHRMGPMLEALRERVKAARKEAQSAARGSVVEQARKIAEESSEEVLVRLLVGADKDTLLPAMDVIRAKRPESAVILFGPDEAAGKVSIAAVVPEGLIKRGLKAGEWVREAAKVCGGGGGGRPDMAQAGGKDPGKVGEAMAAASAFAEGVLG